MKAIKIILQGIIWLLPVIIFWTGFFMWSKPTNLIVAWILLLIFGVYLSNKLFEDCQKFGKWFDSKLK